MSELPLAIAPGVAVLFSPKEGAKLLAVLDLLAAAEELLLLSLEGIPKPLAMLTAAPPPLLLSLERFPKPLAMLVDAAALL